VFRNVLVPVDLSDRGRNAVEAAAELGVAKETTVRLLHVIETIAGVEFEEMEDFYGTLRERAEEVLSRWAGWLSERSIRSQRDIVFGRRAAEILRFASEQKCDLIILASHTLEPEHLREGFGTISHQVALFARCPVLLMRRG
jgi:nucleotide-binding universal stress UspA family protein